MPFTELSHLPSKEIVPGFEGRFIHTDHVTLAYWDIKSGSILPEHSHVNEQISHILEGRFELTIEGETQIVEAGKVAVIPAHANHSAKALTDCKALDVFYPARDDYRSVG